MLSFKQCRELHCPGAALMHGMLGARLLPDPITVPMAQAPVPPQHFATAARASPSAGPVDDSAALNDADRTVISDGNQDRPSAEVRRQAQAAAHSRRALLGAAPLQPGLLAAFYPGQYGSLPIPSTWQVRLCLSVADGQGKVIS